jgi:hypothetical protein
MGYAILPEPGTTHGPCEPSCEHTDCKATRETAEKTCGYCDKPIGYRNRFYQLKLDGEQCFAHARCAEREEEMLRKAM